MCQEDGPKNVFSLPLCGLDDLISFFFLHLSSFCSLIDFDGPHTSSGATPKITQCQREPRKKKAKQLNKGSPYGQTVDIQFSQPAPGWIRQGMRCRDLLRCKKGGEIICVSHVLRLQRERGSEREETCKANGVPHPLGLSVWEYFL